jgi:hypothetical protein
MVFFDGNSTDGTLDIIRSIMKDYGEGHKIKLFENKDPRDLKDDYVRLFNEAMWSLSTDWAWFLHPDMYIYEVDGLEQALKSNAPAMSMHLESVAGEPNGLWYHIAKGRGNLWKNIYRLRNPNLGAHYHGWYGAVNEDVYFSEITGDAHIHYGSNMDLYPYQVHESGVKALHFSDVRPYERRYGRMLTCLRHQGFSQSQAEMMAEEHPRVTVQDGREFRFVSENTSAISDKIRQFREDAEKYKNKESK